MTRPTHIHKRAYNKRSGVESLISFTTQLMAKVCSLCSLFLY